jgi:hypothetical protein
VIPGGKFGAWLVGILGFGSSLFTIILGFLPPGQIPVGNVSTYELIIGGGVVVGCLVPLVVYWLSGMKKTA